MADLALWAAVLNDLETRLDAAARSIAVASVGNVVGSPLGIPASTGGGGEVASSAGDVPLDWPEPSGLGDLPQELSVRAQDLVRNQQKLIGELEQARSLTLKHLTAVRSVPPERDARASVYLDVNG